MKIDITTIYYFIDKFYEVYIEETKKYNLPNNHKLTRKSGLTMAEIMTILIMYNFSPCKNFKFYYLTYVSKLDFPQKVSYQRFIELIPRTIFPICVLLKNMCNKSDNKKDYFIDSTPLAVCHNKRIKNNKVFKGLAALGKTTKGWFYGLKLHLVIDTKGNIVNVNLTKGNVNDRKVVDNLTVDLLGKLFGDKGYISVELFKRLFNRGLQLITGIKKTMRNQLTNLYDKVMLRKRSLIETVFDYLKNKFNIEHTRHRSPTNAFVHIISTLITYSFKPCKPSIKHSFLLQS